jgi:hypothetical protein
VPVPQRYWTRQIAAISDYLKEIGIKLLEIAGGESMYQGFSASMRKAGGRSQGQKVVKLR